MGALTVLAVFIVVNDNSPDNGNSMELFRILLPVTASWVGTVLAFYFGRENFETANVRVGELLERAGARDRAAQLVRSVMRPLAQTQLLRLGDAGEAGVTIAQMRAMFSPSITRLPVVDAEDRPR
jgi:hypothetical protein